METHLFSQFWFTLFDGGHEHVTHTSSWQSVQSTTDTMDSDNIQILTA
jgi:hypothetical protein